MRRLYNRLALVGGRYADVAPATTACCNACRTCVQTNGIALLIGGTVALAASAKRFAGRFIRPH